MVSLLVTIAVLIAAIVLWVYAYRKSIEALWMVSMVATMVFGTLLLSEILVSCLNVPDNVAEFNTKYERTSVLISDGAPRTIDAAVLLSNDITELNNTIEKHKRHAYSQWNGIYYSRKIADADPLIMPDCTIIYNKDGKN